VQPDSHVSWRDIEVRRNVLSRGTGQVNAQQNVCIFWAERWQQSLETIAEIFHQLRVDVIISKQGLFLRVACLAALPGRFASIVVQKHRSEHTVEPGNRTFTIS
jgi:hypothetical protein